MAIFNSRHICLPFWAVLFLLWLHSDSSSDFNLVLPGFRKLPARQLLQMVPSQLPLSLGEKPLSGKNLPSEVNDKFLTLQEYLHFKNKRFIFTNWCALGRELGDRVGWTDNDRFHSHWKVLGCVSTMGSVFKPSNRFSSVLLTIPSMSLCELGLLFLFCMSLKIFPPYFLVFESLIILISTVPVNLTMLFFILLVQFGGYLPCVLWFLNVSSCFWRTVSGGHFWSLYLKYVPPEKIYISFC